MTVLTEKAVLKQILEMYKDLPLLWDHSHELYTNKVKRKEANEKLLETFKLCEPEASLNDVKKKIDNMRTTYKREHQKVIKSRFSGEGEYVPTLWYYNLFKFLEDDENISMRSKVSKDDVSTYNENDEDDEDKREEEYVLKTEEIFTDPPPKKKKRKPNNSILYLSEVEDEQESYAINDQCKKNSLDTSSTELFGKTIGTQLNELKPLQRFIAEKLISEIIFYGRLDKLQPNTAVNIIPNDF